MASNTIRETFSPQHHALLFGWISREVVQRVGEEKGEAIMRQAVQRYGEQRGQRMALRAQANRHPLTMTSYLAYGEWQADPGQLASEAVETSPHFKHRVTRCPWNTAWQENGLISCGRFYCLEIDQALVRGFNADLRVDVHRTQPNGGDACEFTFYDADVEAADALTTPDGMPLADWKPRVLPWDYHIGHLYTTVGAVVIDALGDAGREAVDAALAEFARHFGDNAAQIVTAYQSADFDRLPD